MLILLTKIALTQLHFDDIVEAPTKTTMQKRNVLLHHFSLFEMLQSPASSGDFGNDVIASIDSSNCDPEELVTKRALCRLFECSERTVDRMVARRDLPRPVTVSGRKVWTAGTLGQWLADAAKWKQAEIDAEAIQIKFILAKRWHN